MPGPTPSVLGWQMLPSFLRSTYKFLHTEIQPSPLETTRIKDIPTSLEKLVNSIHLSKKKKNNLSVYH